MRYGQTVTVRITADGDAFADDPDREVARILADIAQGAADGEGFGLFARDVNGNEVGTIKVTGRGRRSPGDKR